MGQVDSCGSSVMRVTDMYAVDTLTSQQLRIVKYTATKLLIGLLADQSLVTEVLHTDWIHSHVDGLCDAMSASCTVCPLAAVDSSRTAAPLATVSCSDVCITESETDMIQFH